MRRTIMTCPSSRTSRKCLATCFCSETTSATSILRTCESSEGDLSSRHPRTANCAVSSSATVSSLQTTTNQSQKLSDSRNYDSHHYTVSKPIMLFVMSTGGCVECPREETA